MALLYHSPGFDVWDISDPESAKRLAWLRSPEPFAITDVWMGDTLVWAVSSSQNADGNGFVGRFEAYRLDDPIHPQLLGSGFSCRDWLPTSVTVTESLALVGTVSGEHDVFDVRDPGLPRRVGKLPIGALRLAAADGLVVTTTYPRVLEVYSLQEGYGQSLKWSVEGRSVLAPGIGHTLGVRSSNGMPVTYEVLSGPAEVRDGALTITNEVLLQSVIVRATQSGGDGFFPVESVRVFNPLAVDFELLGELKLPGPASSISVSEGFAGVAGWAGSMCWVDVRNPSQPRLVTSLETGGGAQKVVVAGEFGYAADFGGKLDILDLRNPETPVVGASLDFGGQAWSVTVSGDLAYVAGQEGIGVVDVSDPIRPHRVGMLARPGNAPVLDLQENQGFLYISESLGGITIADVRDPAHPKVAGSMEAILSAKLVLEQNRLWLGGGSDGLRWADISDPFNPRQELSIPIPLGNNSSYSVPMALKDGIIFCSSERGRVEAFDIHNSNYVLASGSHSLFPEYANGIEVVGDVAYVAAGHRGLMVFRVHQGIRTAVGDLGVPLRGEPGEIVPLPGRNYDGVPMQYEVVSGPARIEGGELRLDGLGSVVLKAFFAPSDRYFPAEAVVSISVVPLVLNTVTGSPGEAAVLNWRLTTDALESAASPAGPWLAIPEARPPFRPTVGDQPRFYRVVRK